jgi:CheY-like chemotaxis protein
MSGGDVCMIVKRDPMTSHIPIILYSAGPRIRERDFVSKVGANATVSKPFKPKEVVQMVSTCLGAPAVA